MDQQEKRVIKVGSVEKMRRKQAVENNKYMQKYGELLWTVALLTAYQNGGYKELKFNYEKVPYRYISLLLDAYKYKQAEEEFTMAKAASRPHLKKKDGKDYIDGLVAKLEGKA